MKKKKRTIPKEVKEQKPQWTVQQLIWEQKNRKEKNR